MYFIISTLVVLLMMGGGAYYYHRSTQATIEQLIKDNAVQAANVKTLKNAVDTSNNTINTLKNDYTEIRENYEELESEFDLLRMYNKELDAKFEDHDLNALALAKPELVEKIINSATSDAFRCLELLSGAPKNSKELNAKTANEFNSECPWLFE